MKHNIEYISKTARDIEENFNKLHIAIERLLNSNFDFISDITFSCWNIYIYCNGSVEGDFINSDVSYDCIYNEIFNISVNNANEKQILELEEFFENIK